MPSEPKKDWLRRIAWSVVGLGLLLALAGLGRYLYEYYGENRMNLIRGLDKLHQGMSEEEVEQVFGVKPHRYTPKWIQGEDLWMRKHYFEELGGWFVIHDIYVAVDFRNGRLEKWRKLEWAQP